MYVVARVASVVRVLVASYIDKDTSMSELQYFEKNPLKADLKPAALLFAAKSADVQYEAGVVPGIYSLRLYLPESGAEIVSVHCSFVLT